MDHFWYDHVFPNLVHVASFRTRPGLFIHESENFIPVMSDTAVQNLEIRITGMQMKHLVQYGELDVELEGDLIIRDPTIRLVIDSD